jgi:hypothetical protein
MQEFNSFEELEEAYKALKQEVALLEQEWRESGVLEEVNSFETEFLEEQTAKEVNKPTFLVMHHIELFTTQTNLYNSSTEDELPAALRFWLT